MYEFFEAAFPWKTENGHCGTFTGIYGLPEKERQSRIAPDADSLLHRASYRRSVRSDLAGHQP